MNSKLLYFLVLYFVYTISGYAQFSAEGGLGSPYSYIQNLGGTGIESVFFYNTFSGATLNYTSNEKNIEFYKYTSSIADKQQIKDADISITTNGDNTTYYIQNLEDSRGYFVEINGGAKNVVWVIDYNKHLPILNSIEPVNSDDNCEYIKLLVDKNDYLSFNAIGGGVHEINRLYKLEYTTLTWNKDYNEFDPKTDSIKSANVGTEISSVPAPLIDTEFILKGDQIAQHFNIEKSISSKLYTAVAVQSYITAEQTQSMNNSDTESNELGGSAPVEISFKGYGNEPTAQYYTWYIYKKTDLENPLQRYTDKDIKYTFKESGDYLIQLNVIDKSSTCTATSTSEFNITDFEWDAPNFFVADGEHKFKISYKSIIKFKCTIFNRWNNKIYEWTDPSQGWDGKHNGKYVNTGVYFYVMTAVSGDGKTHKKAGDINLFRKK